MIKIFLLYLLFSELILILRTQKCFDIESSVDRQTDTSAAISDS